MYQVVYCDSKFWERSIPLYEQTAQTYTWYLLECPAIGIIDLKMARQRAKKELKVKFGERAQVVIIGQIEGQFGRRTADDLFDIRVLKGANATECQTPEVIFSKKSKRSIFYRRDKELRY